jgi:hypothetical protein
VEAELLEVVAAAMPVADDLPTDPAQVISPLALLDDKALWLPAAISPQRQRPRWSSCISNVGDKG